MSKYVIIKKEMLVDIDNIIQQFDFSDLVDENFISIIWDTETKTGILQEETDEEGLLYKTIELTDFTDYQPIIDRYEQNKTVIVSAEQNKLNCVSITYFDGLVNCITIQQAKKEKIKYTEMDLVDAINEKQQEVRNSIDEILNKLFNTENLTDQLRTRTMLSYNWNSLTNKKTLTAKDKKDLALYNEMFDYLTELDKDIITHNTNIKKLKTTQEVIEYEIVLTPIPSKLQDERRSALKKIKLSCI